MTNPFQQHGAVSWCDLITSDQEAAKEFYSQLFGWSMYDKPMGGTNYTVIKANDREIGGIASLSDIQQEVKPPPNWGIFITVDDVDLTAKKTTELGGKILVQPQDIPDVGRFAIIQDPQGAYLSIMTYNKVL